MNTPSHDANWDRIVNEFRQICLLRRQKKMLESDVILNIDLPKSIATWSRTASDRPDVKKARLDTMFQSEQKRVEDAWLVQELVGNRIQNEVVPAMCARMVEQVKMVIEEQLTARENRRHAAEKTGAQRPASRRVLFDDLPGVIDLVIEQQRHEANLSQLAAA